MWVLPTMFNCLTFTLILIISVFCLVVGEPPLLLAESALLALRYCVSAYRTQNNEDISYFKTGNL